MDTNMRTRKVTFADLKPGHKFCKTKLGFAEFPQGVYMRVKGTVVSCIPDEEFGDEYCNTISLTNGEISFVNEMQDVWI